MTETWHTAVRILMMILMDGRFWFSIVLLAVFVALLAYLCSRED